MKNIIRIQPDQEIELSQLPGRFIYVDNSTSPENGGYKILGAYEDEDGGIVLDIGDVSLIHAYQNKASLAAKYFYNIEVGQSFRIPLPTEYDTSPIFTPIGKKSVDAQSELRFTVSATSPAGKELTYTEKQPPRGVLFNPETKTIKWNPEKNQVGTHFIAIEASDGALSATQYIEVQVLPSTIPNKKPPDPVDTKDPEDPKDPEEPKDSGDNDGSGGPGGVVIPPDVPDTGDMFNDLTGFDWAKDAIEALAEKDIIKGPGPGIYSPGTNIKRADFVILLVRAFGLTGAAGENFADVAEDAYYAEQLSAAKANGIIAGIGGNKFNPTAQITREDMMTIVLRALEKLGYALKDADETSLTEFADASEVSDYAKHAVSKLIKNGIITGSEGKINPKGYATRAEIAVLIHRILTQFIN